MASEVTGDNWDSLADVLGTSPASESPKRSVGDESATKKSPHTPRPPKKQERTKTPKQRPPSMFFTEAELSKPVDEVAEPTVESQSSSAAFSKKQPTTDLPAESSRPVAAEPLAADVEPAPPPVSEPTAKAAQETESVDSIESEPSTAVPAAEGFFSSGLALPDWFPFARKSAPKAASAPASSKPVMTTPDEVAAPAEAKADFSEESSSTPSNSDNNAESLEPHEDWLERPSRSKPHKPKVERSGEVGKQHAAEAAKPSDDSTTAANESDRDESTSESLGGEGDDDGAPKTKRRRSRRRGRGRGRSRGERSDESVAEDIGEGEASDGEADDSSEGKKKPGGEKKEKRTTRKRPVAKTDVDFDDDHDDESDDIVDDLRAIDDESDDSDDDSSNGAPSSRASSHRNIPSWLDAISGVVDSNIANRDQRQRSNWPRSDSRSRGGRGRGRRKKTS